MTASEGHAFASDDLLFALLALKEGRLAPGRLRVRLGAWKDGTLADLKRAVIEEAGLEPADVRRLEEASRRASADAGTGDGETGDTGGGGGLLDGLEEEMDVELPSLHFTAEQAPVDRDATTQAFAGRAAQEGAASGLDRYAPGGEIGKGGLGRVIAAVDRVLGREVAMKEMIRSTDDPALLERFLREGEMAGRLLHPNIVPVFDVGVRPEGIGEGGKVRPFFVMGRIVGRDLKEILEAVERGSWERAEGRATGTGIEDDPRRVFSRHRLLRVFQDVCLAIAYAHDHGVIHRDLKPANVMVGRWGEVYVVDWGLAKQPRKPDRPEAPDPPDPPSPGLHHAGAPAEADPPDQGPGGGEEGKRAEPRKTSSVAERIQSFYRAERETEAPDHRDSDTALTLDGEVLGTPSYMAPEQARGDTDAVDERSDIYALGAILYEILSFRPPYEGPNKFSILGQVLKGALVPPSQKVSEKIYPESVPPDLEEIVLKAMAPDRADRYAGVTALHDDVQAFLEGEKEKERNRVNARKKVAEGRRLLDEVEQRRAAYAQVLARLGEERARVKSHWPVEKKRVLWSLETKTGQLQEEIASTFSRAATTFQAAFEFEPRHPEARAALADMYWEQFRREEEGGNRAEMAIYENFVREYNDGRYDEKLKGDGTLAVSTKRFPCRCLLDGRRVSPPELLGSEPGSPGRSPSRPGGEPGVAGFHPFSGRDLAGGEGAEGLPAYEPREPVRLKVHGADCRTEPVEGADVWLFRYEEKDRLLLPCKPALPDQPDQSEPAGEPDQSSGFPGKKAGRRPWSPGIPPEEVLDRLYDPGSPYRPTEGLYLGRTPIRPFRIPMGSYLLVIAGPHDGSPGGLRRAQSSRSPSKKTPLEGEGPPEPPAGTKRLKMILGEGNDPAPDQVDQGFAPVRVPVLIGRNADASVDVTLFREAEIPAGFVHVPAGPFIYQGDRDVPNSQPKSILPVDDFFLAAFDVTCEEYLAFLDDLASRDPKAARQRAPRRPDGVPSWPQDGSGRFCIPTPAWLEEAAPGEREKAGRLQHATRDWEEDWPVMGISWEDAVAFAAWRRKREGFAYRLPTAVEWEKAARGVDARLYPWGHGSDDSFCNNNRAFPDGIHPAGVRAMPADESPYGVRGLGGNGSDPCLESLAGTAGWRVVCGGSWGSSGYGIRAAYRLGAAASSVYPPRISIRLACPVRLAGRAM